MSIKIIGTLGANTGKTVGDVRMGRPKAIILTLGKEFSAADLADSATFKAQLEAAMLLSKSSVNKVYVFGGLREVDDNTGDPNVGSLADGYEEVLTEALAKYTLKNTAGVAQTQSLVAFNGWTDKAYVVDDKNILWYVVRSIGGAKGWSVGSLYTTPPRFGGSGNINVNLTKITFGTVEEFKIGVGALKLDFNVEDLTNLVDVDLKEVAAAAGYIFKIGGKNKFAGTDIYETYQDLLAVVGAWKATRLDTGANVVVSAVAKDAVNKGWSVTLDNGVAIAAGVKVRIELVDPAALKALATPVTGIESSYVIVTKP